jgi:hypothetical protein
MLVLPCSLGSCCCGCWRVSTDDALPSYAQLLGTTLTASSYVES